MHRTITLATTLLLSLPAISSAQTGPTGVSTGPLQELTPNLSGTYRIQALPALGNDLSSQNTNATGMNELGHVVGVAEDEQLNTHAVVWVDGQIAIDLLNQPGEPDSTFINGKGINNHGVAVGQGVAPWGGGAGTQGVPMSFQPGTGLFNPSENGSAGWSWAINDSGQIGFRAGSTYIYDPVDGVREVTLPNGSWEIWEINNAGVATGAGRGPNFFLHAFRYDYETDTIVDLGSDSMFPNHSEGYGINDAGDIVGWANVSGSFKHPIVWANDGRRIILETGDMSPNHLLGTAEHINGHGDTVGHDLSVAAEPGIGWIAYDVLSVGIADLTTEGSAPGDRDYGVPDRLITDADMRMYLSAWLAFDVAVADLTTEGSVQGDLDHGVPDGLVTGDDLGFFQDAWNAGPTSPVKISIGDLLTPLERAAWSQLHPFEINDAGQICGIGVRGNSTRGFLMTPFVAAETR